MPRLAIARRREDANGPVMRSYAEHMRRSRFGVSVASSHSGTWSPGNGLIIASTASPIAPSYYEAVFKSRWYYEKCLAAATGASALIGVTIPRPKNNQPETILRRLPQLGAVSAEASPCSKSWNLGASTLLAESN